MFIPLKKATLLIPSSPEDTNHLFVIITNPCKHGKVLIVNLTTIKTPKHDNACIVNSGEHEFVKRPSYIMYRYAQIVEANNLAKGVKSGKFVAHKPISDDLLTKICDGILCSTQIEPIIREYFIDNCDH